MSPAQQKHSIYDQGLLALLTALDKWQHLLRGAKVMAYTDHQALTCLQQLRASKPLRGRRARWLDFLEIFPGLEVLYVCRPCDRVAAPLSGHPEFTPRPGPPADTPSVPSALLALVTLSQTPHLPVTPPGATLGITASWQA